MGVNAGKDPRRTLVFLWPTGDVPWSGCLFHHKRAYSCLATLCRLASRGQAHGRRLRADRGDPTDRPLGGRCTEPKPYDGFRKHSI